MPTLLIVCFSNFDRDIDMVPQQELQEVGRK